MNISKKFSSNVHKWIISNPDITLNPLGKEIERLLRKNLIDMNTNDNNVEYTQALSALYSCEYEKVGAYIVKMLEKNMKD